MKTLTVTKARQNFFKLIEDINKSHEPIQIVGKNKNAVILSEEDWSSIQETLYLLSIPGMRESIIDGMKEKISNCSRDLNW
jgi:prevent-host-death family protein